MPNTAEHWTAARVRALPDDGNRYELIDGELVVTPAPRGRHQVAIAELYDRLRAFLADGRTGRVLFSPADLSLGENEVLQPDLFVYRTATGQPLGEWSDVQSLILVVEVLSPSTSRNDHGLKRRRYQRAGVPEYWIVDVDGRFIERWRPDDTRPEILADELRWPAAGDAQMELDVEGYFRAVWGEALRSRR